MLLTSMRDCCICSVPRQDENLKVATWKEYILKSKEHKGKMMRVQDMTGLGDVKAAGRMRSLCPITI
jgi:hypothetical protein